MSYLFGKGIDVMDIYFTLVIFDLIIGYLKALKTHRWKSALCLEGLLKKFVSFATIVSAASLDKLAPIIDIELPINIALAWTILLITYEIGSILENTYQLGLKIGFLQKWLAVFDDTISNKQVSSEKTSNEDQDQSNN